MPKPRRTLAKRRRKSKPAKAVTQERESALVILGDGLGNFIEQTPIAVAAAGLFQHVDVLSTNKTREAHTLIAGDSRFRTVTSSSQDLAATYSAVLVTHWTRYRIPAAYKKLPIYNGSNPERFERSEIESCFNAIRLFGVSGPIPDPVCRTADWPGSLPEGTLIGLGTGSLMSPAWKMKRYPAANYARVVDLLLHRNDSLKFVLAGNLDDDPVDHPCVIDCRGQGTLLQTAGLLARCSLFIGNDSGLAHMAAAVGTKTVVLFGPTRISKNLPRNAVAVSRRLDCQPCQYKRYGMGRYADGVACRVECLRELLPIDVVRTVMKELT